MEFTDENINFKEQLSTLSSPAGNSNISRLLLTIIQFAQARQKVLINNIKNLNKSGYTPQEVPITEFARIIHTAIDEHLARRRLLFYDTQNIKFGPAGSIKINSTPDNTAKMLLRKDKEKYLELQINKLLENSINWRLATRLLSASQQPQSR